MPGGGRTTVIRERLLERFLEPIVVLEMRQLRRRKPWRAIAIIAAVAISTLALLRLNLDASSARMLLEMTAMGYFVFAMVAAVAHGGQSAYERESGIFDMLAVTPMTSSMIADQKIIVAAAPTLGLLAACLPMAVLVVGRGGASVLQVAALGAILAFYTLAATTVFVCNSREKITLARRLSTIPVALAFLPFIAGLMYGVHGSTQHRVLDMLHSWLFVIAMVWLSCMQFATHIGVMTTKRFPAGHPRRRLALTTVGVGTLAIAALYLSPMVRDCVAYAWYTVVGTYVMCLMPFQAIIELAGDGASTLGFVPDWMPPHTLVVGTLVVQGAGFAIVRRNAARSIERIRRGA